MKRVLVVGAGPAGMSAAYFLSLHEGYDITVAERLDTSYSRYHSVCGGGISKAAFRKLSPMRPEGVLNGFSGTRIVWPDGTEIRMRTPGYILDRPAFLGSLKSQCIEKGVRFVNAGVTGVTYDGTYHSVTDSGIIDSDWIIGADGACSAVRRSLFGSSPARMIPATEYVVDKAPDSDLTIRLLSDGSGTYTWSFPRGNVTGTGGMKGYEEQQYLSKGSRFIPVGGIGKISSERAMLIGDAAAMANPVSFGGLRAALISGRKASEAIVKDDSAVLQRWWDSSILSDRRFMGFNDTLRGWSEEEMNDAVRPFRHGGIYLPGIWACIRRPRYVNMYFGCLFAFRYGW